MTAAILLSGGTSTRMGTDKARITLDGLTLRERALRVLGEVSSPVVDVDRSRSSAGPLAAVAAGWDELGRRGHAGAALVLAVDMPYVTAPLLAFLSGHGGSAVPVADGRLQPLCARYAGSALARAASMVAAGATAMHELLDTIEFEVVPPDAWSAVAPANAFRDLDTPGDLADA